MLYLESSKISNIEQQLHSELELEMNTHQLAVAPAFQFTTSTLSERLAEIRQLATERNGDAVIWLEKSGKHTVTLQLVVVAPGQSTVRSVESVIGEDGDIGELVIAARELLHDIYIPLNSSPSPAPTKTKDNNSAKPTSTMEQTSDRANPVSPQEPAFYLSTEAGVEAPLLPADSSPILLNGSLGFGFDLPANFSFSLLFSFFGAPAPHISEGTLKTFGIRPGLGFDYQKKSNKIAWGPYLSLFVPYQKAQLSLNVGENRSESWWNLRIAPGIQLAIYISPRIKILLRPGLAINLRQKVFKQRSDGATIYQTPYVDANISIGIIFNFN